MLRFNQFITEAKVSMTKLKPGMKVTVTMSGRSAKNFGVEGETIGPIKILGVGIVPRKAKGPEKNHVVAKDLKDFKAKNKDAFAEVERISGANAKLRAIANEEGGMFAWIFEDEKGEVGMFYVSSDDKWEVPYLNKSVEFKLES